MIVVFWLQNGTPYHVTYQANEMSAALTYMEGLRSLRREGKPITHVCMQSELPEVVGEAGVADPSKDYAWYKRREDPAILVGRKPTGDDIEVDLSGE